MSRAAAGSTTSVDPSTIASLLKIVLRIPQCNLHATATELRCLLDSDAAFRSWAESTLCESLKRESSNDGKGHPLLEQHLANKLPSLLIQYPAWLGPSSRSDSIAAALVDAANLVLRTQAFENNFRDDLDQKFDRAVYNFAYGLSHELNNPLANISTRAGVLLQRSESPEQKQLLSAIVDNAMRGCEMLGDLMLIARPPKLQLASLATAEFLSELAAAASPHAEVRKIRLVKHLAESLPDVQADATALHEALWALTRNAMEAMPDGGQVDLAARVIDANSGVEASGGQKFLHIQISDNGTGLSDEALKCCFDIFYSSREAGRGLGVGLAKAKRIIDLHGGKISIANRPSGGCSVIVLLPV